VSFWGIREKNKTSGQKEIDACQFHGFKKIIRRFYLQADRAPFSGAVMIMACAYQRLGKKG
jgi:hypothetical protein